MTLTDIRNSLQQALGQVYQLERELRGGMSRVFVAREIALGRTVVLKVLPPDLTAGLSSERFRREIQVAANLQHPHIVPLLSAGEAGDFLYYTMPFVEGESLRVRLERQGELPVPLALRILDQVTRALAYAHRHGVVHRDIKPDNILLSEDEALVADFGIAKAITASAEQGTLTSVGIALGTPLYMAPEQAAADPTTDGRADLYSLGVVAYEMLAGQPPFQGRTAAHLLAAHATEQPAPLQQRRPAVPPGIAGLVMRLLEKRPADRPQSADELLRLLEAAAVSPGPATASSALSASSASSAPSRGRWMVAGGIAALGLAGLVAWLARREPPVAADRAVVAVAPFRVGGADSSLAYLSEGMVDLLAAKLSGTTGLRPADPRTLLSAWKELAGPGGDLPQRGARELAVRVGAGRLIQGEIVGTRRQITINAALLDAGSGKRGASATVEGSPDSIPRLVDRLAGQLLALEAGEGEQRLDYLTGTPLPALRAYLEGQALTRRGEFRGAADRFALAIQHDSSFALAGLGFTRAAAWFGGNFIGPGSMLAWKHREKLPPVDRALLEVYLGSRWPAPRLFRDGIIAAERMVQIAPDNPEAWFELGDELYHWGGLLGYPDPLPRAARAFERALALDSGFAPSLEHGTSLALALGDTAAAKNALRLMRRVDSTSGHVAAQQWELALVLGDSAARLEALENDSLAPPFLMAIGLTLGYPLEDLGVVLRSRRRTAVTAEERRRTQRQVFLHSLIVGRPGAAEPLLTDIPERERLALVYLMARFADADSTGGAAEGAQLEAAIGSPVLPQDPDVMSRWAAGLRALDGGRLDRARQALADLERVRLPPDSAWLWEIPAPWALLLRTQLAAERGSPELPRLLDRLDSALTNPSNMRFTEFGNLIASRLFEEQGDLPRALAAIRRRVFDLNPTPVYVTYHREEGRLAALNGDREGAIRAYRRYLALRSGAEPRLQPQVDRIRAELHALERESTDR